MSLGSRSEKIVILNDSYNLTDRVAERELHYNAIKRFIDIAGSLLGLIGLSPFFIIVAILVKVADPKGSVFFKQKRIGINSEKFYIIKFRSMVHNAEEKLRSNKILYQKYVRNGYKLDPEEDTRITRIGRFLRKTSLDELPQLVNVLKGEMSLVGPRPIITEELKEYGASSKYFTSVKPGLTGLWQVSGRSDVNYPERVDLELEYVFKRSTGFDIYILIKTVWIVLTKRGAY